MHIISVSIIVPIYNVELYVEDSIRSVMCQTYDGPLECIVVDDCGTDDSMVKVEKLISEYTGPITFKVLHHTHNRGLSAARNTGMDAATGDYLYFLDSDDEITDDCIKELAEPLLKNHYDIVVGDLEMIGSDKPYGSLKLKLEDKTIIKSDKIFGTYHKRWNETATNKLYRSSFVNYESLRFKEGLLFEDELWSFQVACLAESLFAVNKITYIIRDREGSITSSSSNDTRIKNCSIILAEMVSFAKKKNKYNFNTHQFVQNFFFMVLRYSSESYNKFAEIYKNIRPEVKPTIKCLLKGNKYRYKCYIRDIHYFLPSVFAPYWLYYFIDPIQSLRNRRRNDKI